MREENHFHIDKNDNMNDPHYFYAFDSDSTFSSSSFHPCYHDNKDSSSSHPCYIDSKDSSSSHPCYIDINDSSSLSHPCYIDSKDSSSSHSCHIDNKDSSSSHSCHIDNKDSSSSSSIETTDFYLLKKRCNVQIISVHDYQELRAYYAFLDKSNESQQQGESINSSIQSIRIVEDPPSIPNQSEKTTVVSSVDKVPLYLHDLENLTFQSPNQSLSFTSSTIHNSYSQLSQKTARVSSLSEEKNLNQQSVIPHTNELSIKLHKHHAHKQKRTTKSNHILVRSFSVSKHASFPVLSNQMKQSSAHI